MENILQMIQSVDLAKEWIGLLASFVLVLSFVFKDVTKFRIVNSIAALIWIAYGLDINSISVIITNTFIIGFNFKHLYTDLKTKEEFK